MALITWRKRDTEGKPQGPTLYLDFDATLLEEFTRAAEVTQFPVENGSVLSDHYQPQPRAITLEVQVSDTPVHPRALIDGKESAINEPFGQERPKHLDLPVNQAPVTSITSTRIVTANAARFPKQRTASVLQFDGEVYRTVDVFLALDDLMQVGQLVDVLLFREVEYKDMVITNIRTPRDAASGSTLTFTIDLLQITFADTETGDTPEPTNAKHKGKKDGGAKGASPDDPNAFGAAQQQRFYPESS
jgi:hypothetical protein